MVGLLLIAIGTGGIKPCVSAFGGDQFEEGQVRSYSQETEFMILCQEGQELCAAKKALTYFKI